jgi:hypothetical protein
MVFQMVDAFHGRDGNASSTMIGNSVPAVFAGEQAAPAQGRDRQRGEK